jgi:hypothetical protein
MKGRVLALVFIFCIALSTFTSALDASTTDQPIPNFLTLEVKEDSFEKGDRIVIRGKANVEVEVTAYNEERIVFSEKVPVEGSGFYLEYETSFTDPTGEWRIVAEDGLNSKEELVTVSETRESSFLSLVFLSPAPTTFRRTETIEVSVKVSDAGSPLSEAQVYFWGADGDKISLSHTGEGIYSKTYRIPEDGISGPWNLTAVASHRKIGETIGGEGKIALYVEKSPLTIVLVDPVNLEFYFDKPVEIKVNVLYYDESTMSDGNVLVGLSQVNDYGSFPMKLSKDGLFTVSVPLMLFENQILSVHFEASDIYGNSSDQIIGFEPRDYLIYLIKANILIIGVVIIVLAGSAFLVFTKTKTHLDKKTLFAEEKRLYALKKKNQKNYLVERSITRVDFDKRDAELDVQIRDVKNSMMRLDVEEAKLAAKKQTGKVSPIINPRKASGPKSK